MRADIAIMSDWDPRANEIFLAAVELADVDKRRALLDERCGGDHGLRAAVESLLAASEGAGDFLEQPAVDAAPTIVGDDLSLDFLDPAESPDSLGRLGEYEISSVIGRGGMGIVLEGQDTKLNRVVAVKVLAPEMAGNATARRRFLREARAAAAITHQQVVTIHAVSDDKLPYLVMECIAGQSLQEKIEAEGTFALKEVLRIGSQVAAGLAAAHAQGLVHRDIKPSNILLENGVERVRITDFGLARAVDDVDITGTGQVTGSPQYMSPEQAQGHTVDARSDLFSLGCVLYAMCTGRSPFRAETTIAALRRVCDETPRPLRVVNPEVPDWLVQIIDRLLEKNATDRIQTASEVAELLGAHLAHLQDPESTPSPASLVRACRRERKRFRHGLLVVVLLLLGIGGLYLVESSGITNLVGTDGSTDSSNGTPAKDAPDSQPSRPAPSGVGPGGEVDLLGMVDPQSHSMVGQWRIENDVLISPGTGRWDRLDMLYPPPEEYDLEVTAERRSGDDMLSITLLSGEQQFFVGLDMFEGRLCGLGLLDGKDAFTNETTIERAVFGDRLPHKIICRVRKGGVSVTVDGELLIDWNGSLDRLSIPDPGRTGRLGLMAMNSEYRFYDIILKPVESVSDSPPTITEVRRFEGHTGSVRQIAVSRDGALALSCSGVQADRSVRLWEVVTGREIRSFDTSGRQMLAVAFSCDEQRVVGAGIGGVISFWNIDTGDLIMTLESDTEFVTDLAFSCDGRHLLCTSHKRRFPTAQNVPDLSAAQLWDLDTEECLWQCNTAGWLETCGFLEDDEHVVVAGRQTGCAIHLLDRQTGDELRQFNYADSTDHQIEGLAISHDGQYIATASELGYVYLWDVNDTEAPIKFRPSMGNLRSVAFSPDDSRLVCGSGEGIAGSIHLLEVPSLELVAAVEHPGGLAWHVAYLPDGRHALSGGGWSEEGPGDYALRLWGLPETGDDSGRATARISLSEASRFPTAHEGPVLSVAASPNGTMIATGSSDKHVHLLDRDTSAVLHKLIADTAYDLKFTSDGLQILAAGDDATVRLWDVETGEQIRRYVGHTDRVNSVDLSEDGRTVLTGGVDGTIRIWDFDSGNQLHKITAGVAGEYKFVFSVAFDAANERFVSAHHDGTVTIWDAATREQIATIPAHESYAYVARFSPDGRTLLTAGNDNAACLWDVESRRRLQTLPHGDEVTEGEFLAGNRFIVTSSRDKTVSVWNVKTGQRIAETTTLTHFNSAIALLPDGHHLVSAGGLLRSHSENGRMIWVGDGDYDIRLWRLPKSVWEREPNDAAPSESGAFVVFSRGDGEHTYDSLANAVANSRPGNTIEIRGDGPFVTQPLVLRHALTIRAGTGFRPVIERSRSAWFKDRSLLTSHAPLVVEGLHFKHDVDGIEKPRFLDTYDVEVLRVSNCRFENAKDGYAITGEAADVAIENCEFFVPNGFTVAFPPQTNGRWVIDNCVHVGTIGFFNSVASVVQIAPPDPENTARIELSRNTVVTKSGLYLGRFKALDVPAHEDALSPIQIHASSNLFDTWSTAFLASFQVVADDGGAAAILPADAARLPTRLIDWTGTNNAYPARGNMILLQFFNRQEFSEKAHATELAEWVEFWDAGEVDSLQGEARFVGEYRDGSFVAESRPQPREDLRAEHFRLHPDSAGYRAGPDGADLGADIDLVGPGAAYERWKQTPDYAEWLEATGQLMNGASE